jgi:hypothetical protein
MWPYHGGANYTEDEVLLITCQEFYYIFINNDLQPNWIKQNAKSCGNLAHETPWQ